MRRIQIKNKVVDLGLVEEMNIDSIGFSVTLNNGRVLEFYPEPFTMKPLLTGTPQELDTFMRMQRDRSMEMKNEDLKELFYTDKGNRDGGKYVLNLYDKKERDKKQLENYEALAATYRWAKQQFKKFKETSVIYERTV